MSAPFLIRNFPRAILHVDGDGFFAGCEVAKNPSLRGKPVVVGRERGMALAMTYEAKARGVKRGMTGSEVKRICPDVIFLDADHESYELFSHRMNNVIERYSSDIERYSVDESFADITGMRLPLKMSYEEIALSLKKTLREELGMTFSIGVAPTKVLAKIASNFKKPDGLTIIPGKDIETFLAKFPIGDVWGIGKQTTAYMEKLHIKTALEFANSDQYWVESHFSKPYQELWKELRGEKALALHTGERKPYVSLMRTRTFTPPRSDRKFIIAELSRHVEVVCARAREHGLAGRNISFFLKTQGFKYVGLNLRLSRTTNIPEEVLALVLSKFGELYEEHTLYRAAGVTISDLTSIAARQLDLFDITLRIERLEKIYKEVDELNVKHGKTLVHLASSTHLFHKEKATKTSLNDESFARIGIPFIGTVS
jgi:DNA polymerase-4/DNA polymerase V